MTKANQGKLSEGGLIEPKEGELNRLKNLITIKNKH
jgi:hypothetical protein